MRAVRSNRPEERRTRRRVMKRKVMCIAVKLALTAAVVSGLSACGGSDGASNETASAAASAGTNVGPVSGFGSVYVNGTRFRTDGTVSSDDGIERETQLEKGMILKVRGDWDDQGSGEAERIFYDDTLRGPLASAAWDDTTQTGLLVVAGQDIRIDSQTVFKGATPTELQVTPSAWEIRVSAWRLDDGGFRASFVGANPVGSGFNDSNEVEIEGVVANLDALAETFTISGYPVDYGMAVFDDDLDEADLVNGMVVEVEGFIDGGVLFVREIDDEDDVFEENDDVEVGGAISGSYDPDLRQFKLNGFTVQVANDTEFEDGLLESDLADGVLIKVEGNYQNGVILAEEVEPREGDAEVNGVVESLESDFMVVSGVRVFLTASTLISDSSIKDDSDDDLVRRTQDIENLNVGDFLEVEGRSTGDSGGGLVAHIVDQEDDLDEFELEGPVTAFIEDRVTVLGLELSGNTIAVSEGDWVEVGYYKTTGGDYVIRSLELESDDSE
eukprot:TRINITY_DN17449_c0_g2_i1.p1 TRINITY_DN17449_c0_g2~~TRINITY_DN17449_c0_g2_i1.p1  ORF type:complete len:499 (+),score=72.71 TRINITY_DN17449_c0_g2_i1:70-1566(+)